MLTTPDHRASCCITMALRQDVDGPKSSMNAEMYKSYWQDDTNLQAARCEGVLGRLQ